MVVYLKDGTNKKLTEFGKQTICEINLSDLGPYANEIRYFADCVLCNQPAEKVKQSELETVIKLLKNF